METTSQRKWGEPDGAWAKAAVAVRHAHATSARAMVFRGEIITPLYNRPKTAGPRTQEEKPDGNVAFAGARARRFRLRRHARHRAGLQEPRRPRRQLLRRQRRHGRRHAEGPEETEDALDARLHLHARRGSGRLREGVQAL